MTNGDAQSNQLRRAIDYKRGQGGKDDEINDELGEEEDDDDAAAADDNDPDDALDPEETGTPEGESSCLDGNDDDM